MSIISIHQPGSRTLTHIEFRRKFTQDEREWADELEATFENNPAFTASQKRLLRTGYKDFATSLDIDLDDPSIPLMLEMYVALGGLSPTRPLEILA